MDLPLLPVKSDQTALMAMQPSPAVLQHISHRLLTEELSKAEVAVAEAHFRPSPVGAPPDVQAGTVQRH